MLIKELLQLNESNELINVNRDDLLIKSGATEKILKRERDLKMASAELTDSGFINEQDFVPLQHISFSDLRTPMLVQLTINPKASDNNKLIYDMILSNDDDGSSDEQRTIRMQNPVYKSFMHILRSYKLKYHINDIARTIGISYAN